MAQTAGDKYERVRMLLFDDVDEHLAKIKWSIYLRYGIGVYDNWLSMKRAEIKRQDIVAALGYESVRQYAKNTIEECRSRIAEIESMLSETIAVHSVEDQK